MQLRGQSVCRLLFSVARVKVTLGASVMSEQEIIVNDYASLLRRQKSSLEDKLC